MNESIPAKVSEQERWIVHNRVDTVRIEDRMTGVDTSETYIHLSAGLKSVCWLRSTFDSLAMLRFSYGGLVEPKCGLREKVEAREKWEKANAAELATYRRLKAKFEGGTDTKGNDDGE